MRELTKSEWDAREAAWIMYGKSDAQVKERWAFNTGFATALDYTQAKLTTLLSDWHTYANHPDPSNPIACAAVRECIEDLERILTK